MAERKEITATLDGTAFGSSLKDLEDGDLSRGYFNAAPEGDYERSLGAKPAPFDYPEMAESDGDGFLRRPGPRKQFDTAERN